MLSPTSSTPVALMEKTRRLPLPSSTTVPASLASMLTARVTQSAVSPPTTEEQVFSLERSYVPAASTIVPTAALLRAETSPSTVLTFSDSGGGAGGGGGGAGGSGGDGRQQHSGRFAP